MTTKAHILQQNLEKNLIFYRKKGEVALRHLGWKLTRPVIEKPIFVIGCSRAGTTLVYKTLSQAIELGSLNRETHDLWAQLHPIQAREWKSHQIPESCACDRDRDFISSYFYARTGKLRFVDKNNQNGLSVLYLNRLFPDAIFVYVKRHPGDNIHSLIQGWGKPNEFATWSNKLPLSLELTEKKYRKWCFFLAQGWQEYRKSSIEEVCSFQYMAMNKAILNAKPLLPTQRWHEIFYEELVADPVKSFSHLFEDLGLNFTANMEQHCAQVLSNPYNAFSSISLNKWQSSGNREKVQHVLPGLEPLVRRMGYHDLEKWI